MKNFLLFIGFLFLCFGVGAQEIQHEAITAHYGVPEVPLEGDTSVSASSLDDLGLLAVPQPQQILKEVSQVINIEVPVRVFKGGVFVDSLTINDFEVLEDGIKQKVEAVYLIKKDTIERGEDKQKKFSPETERTFFLFFELTEYDPRISDSLDYFVNNVLLPGDNLIAVSPLKTYRLKDRGIEIKTKQEIAEELRSIIRKDTVLGSSEYRSALKDLEELARTISGLLESDPADRARILNAEVGTESAFSAGELEEFLTRYAVYLQKLEILREVNQLKLLDFAEYLKEREGQSNVFIFYQREFIPQIDPKVWMQAQGLFQDYYGVDIGFFMADILNFTFRDITVDVERVKRAYADASTAVHFMFISRIAETIPGVYFAERSSDIFSPFLEMAKASGGFADSSANPDYLFKKAVAASENYYLLYYAPTNYAGDGEFKNIKVRVKEKGHKVIHRLGYYSN